MPTRIRRPVPPTHVVLVDTSVLFCEDKAPPVDPKFDTFWKEHLHLGTFELVIPAMVRSELLFQQTMSAVKARDEGAKAVSRVSAVCASAHQFHVDDETIRKHVEEKFDTWLGGHAGRCLPTPLTGIDWNSMCEAAVWRQPPFESDPKNRDNEKGFRDAIILETVVGEVKRDTRPANFLFLCNDGLLRATAKARLLADTRFSCFESLEELSSYLKLIDQRLTNAFVRDILSRANEKFYSAGDKSCLYFRVREEIQRKFSSQFDPAAEEKKPPYLFTLLPSMKYEAVDGGRFWISSAAFLSLVLPREYHWTSTVTFVRGILASDKTKEFLLTPGVTPEQQQWIQLLPFVVSWKASVKSDGRFHDVTHTNIELKDKAIRPVTEAEKKKYGLFPERLSSGTSS